MNSERIEELIEINRRGLLEDVMPFWIEHAPDREQGGYFTALDRDGSILDTDKSMWAQGRFAWMLATLYNTVETREEWIDLARSGIEFIRRHGFDEDGRLFFHVTREGKPIRKRRYAFTECFASMAMGAYAKATGDADAATEALELFERFRRHTFEPGESDPKFASTRPAKGLGPLLISIGTCQELRGDVGYGEADSIIDEAIAEIRRDFLKPDRRAVMETVGPGGEILDHFDGRLLNPGHAIEAAWFIMREGMHRKDPSLIDTGTEMLDWMWERGWDPEFGGLFYFRDLDEKPVQEYWHDMKFWWPHNEAIIATLLAHHLTGDEKYVRMHDKVHAWAHRNFPDAEHGEWFGYLHRDGTVSTPLKGNLWKGPFHLPRMQWYCWSLLERMRG